MRHFLNQQKGVYLPIIAFVVISILTIIIGVGFDSVLVKRASQQLRTNLETICENTSLTPTLKPEAMQTFANQINNMVSKELVKNARITKAKLTIPTMPANGDFAFYDPTRPTTSYPMIDWHYNFSDLTYVVPSKCFLTNGVNSGPDCEFEGATTTENYPAGMWNNIQNAGNTVACEVEAEVNTFFGGFLGQGTQIIKAKSAWRRPVRGEFAEYDPNNPIQTSPGLTIAVATEFTTRISNYMDLPKEKFVFNRDDFAPGVGLEFGFQTGNPAGINRTFYNSYDPLRNYDSITLKSSPFNRPNQGVIGFGVGRNLSQTYPTDRYWVFLPPGTGDLAGDLNTYPSGNLSDKDREERLVACLNPLSLARNTFLATLTELASRHGQTRNMTEILHINPQNRVLSNINDLNSLPLFPNHPVAITRFGEDLAQQSFQIPAVTYYTGDDVNLPPQAFAPDPSRRHEAFGVLPGWIDPLLPWSTAYTLWPSSLSSSPGPQNQHWYQHNMLAKQLRDCYHLYTGSGATSYGISRYMGSDIHSDKAGMEPSNFIVTPSLRLKNYAPGDSQVRWDQECPWKGACSPPTTPQTRNLTAAEVMSVLGSTQMCPHEGRNLAANELGLPCTKPADAPLGQPSNDLRPDLLGLMYYLHRTDATYTDFPALNSPGYYPIEDPANPANINTYDGPKPAAPSRPRYAPTENTSSHIVLVLHTRLGSAEKAAIKAQVTKDPSAPGPLANRLFTVVYFPATKEDADPQSVQDLMDAFEVPVDPKTSPDPYYNMLYVFSPFDDKYTQSKPEYPQFNHADPDQNFKDYWLYLLSDVQEPQEAVWMKAREIFYERLLAWERKF